MLAVKKEPMELKNGMIVNYVIDGNPCYQGRATVIGIATTGSAVIGRSVILKDLSGHFPNEVYPFECFVCFECWMTEEK